MKMYGGKGVGIAGSFLISAVAGGEWAELLVNRFRVGDKLQIYVELQAV
jgi:hypothetical protein